jgi:hypothetical protein
MFFFSIQGDGFSMHKILANFIILALFGLVITASGWQDASAERMEDLKVRKGHRTIFCSRLRKGERV